MATEVHLKHGQQIAAIVRPRFLSSRFADHNTAEYLTELRTNQGISLEPFTGNNKEFNALAHNPKKSLPSGFYQSQTVRGDKSPALRAGDKSPIIEI